MDLEARAHDDHHDALRLWLRMLTCTQLIETQVRQNLREQFSTTLPRFDLMAQLERQPEGMRMNELSRRLMVTGGNVTGITDQLESEKLVERIPDEADRRAYRIRLTARGKKAFSEMAVAHERWIIDAFSGLSNQELKSLYKLLGQTKRQINHPNPTHSTVAKEDTHERG